METNREKIVVLWIVFLLGMTLHTLLAMLPIFFGVDVGMSDATGQAPASMMWMSLLTFLIPLILIAMTPFISAKWYKIVNLIFSLLFTLMNVFHPIEHIQESPVDLCQVVLLLCVLFFSVLLNVVSFKWLKDG